MKALMKAQKATLKNNPQRASEVEGRGQFPALFTSGGRFRFPVIARFPKPLRCFQPFYPLLGPFTPYSLTSDLLREREELIGKEFGDEGGL